MKYHNKYLVEHLLLLKKQSNFFSLRHKYIFRKIGKNICIVVNMIADLFDFGDEYLGTNLAQCFVLFIFR